MTEEVFTEIVEHGKFATHLPDLLIKSRAALGEITEFLRKALTTHCLGVLPRHRLGQVCG